MKYIPNLFKVRGLTSDFWFTRVHVGDVLPKGPGLIVFVGEAPSGEGLEPRFSLTFAISTQHLHRAWSMLPQGLAQSGLHWTVGIMEVDERRKLEQWLTDLQAGIALHRLAA